MYSEGFNFSLPWRVRSFYIASNLMCKISFLTGACNVLLVLLSRFLPASHFAMTSLIPLSFFYFITSKLNHNWWLNWKITLCYQWGPIRRGGGVFTIVVLAWEIIRGGGGISRVANSRIYS